MNIKKKCKLTSSQFKKVITNKAKTSNLLISNSLGVLLEQEYANAKPIQIDFDFQFS